MISVRPIINSEELKPKHNDKIRQNWYQRASSKFSFGFKISGLPQFVDNICTKNVCQMGTKNMNAFFVIFRMPW